MQRCHIRFRAGHQYPSEAGMGAEDELKLVLASPRGVMVERITDDVAVRGLVEERSDHGRRGQFAR